MDKFLKKIRPKHPNVGQDGREVSARDKTIPPQRTQSFKGEKRRSSSWVNSNIDAETWEKRELARIKDKYEKLKNKIIDWEQRKKTKAKRRLEKIEAELDKKRTKATKRYKSELARIENIAGGARSQAAENRKNEELKAKEKANKIRLTGKLPATCWCF